MAHDERTPLLRDGGEQAETQYEYIDFAKDDGENPRLWPRSKKMTNVAVIAAMAILSPLASSMFTPGIQQVADDLNTSTRAVVATQSGFVIALGIGPLVLAPLSETFGRRVLYMVGFSTFTLLQIPAALAPNIELLIAVRTVSGFFGSVGIANGGGTISDMFPASERAGVFGWYLLGPLLGPTLGPLFGGVIVQRLGWRWVYWVLLIVCAANTLAGWLFLKESYAPRILALRKRAREKIEDVTDRYTFTSEDRRPLSRKLRTSLARPFRIFLQPIVITMSIYQALIFATTYSLYTNFQDIYGELYGFNSEQVGLIYLGPGLGFLTAVWFLVPKIDTVYNRLASNDGGKGKPEFRLPLTNIGSVLVPGALFWFAWTVEYKAPWPVTLLATYFYGIGQVMIINTVQNYYIDSFEAYAASAIAAGAVFRSFFGGVVPLFSPSLFKSLGYGWGISVFAFIGVALAPAPLVFMKYGTTIRHKFRVNL
ncbi:MFS general substrate transporter [Pseudovirgaria hyperparasitica]|uniref:MFS general substrate transporter n=1 Tax=Pseudovirgaria hyperparasitica TaxID=470096 RepID=A0A6A6VWH4_9PEZI|nr:MFS general substrate transporter [Pseudovirgaria hyperparasitica]KAF2754199.1 MFS general substrate transporter [Pseudovirgaria hyperparasitica]